MNDILPAWLIDLLKREEASKHDVARIWLEIEQSPIQKEYKENIDLEDQDRGVIYIPLHENS